jgi:hypothetical protein
MNDIRILALGLFVLGCGGAVSPGDAALAAKYEAEQLQCVDMAKTKAESQECRCQVKARYNRPCSKDAGAE